MCDEQQEGNGLPTYSSTSRAHLRARTAIALAGAASLTSTRSRFVVVAALVCLVDHSNDKTTHYAKHLATPTARRRPKLWAHKIYYQKYGPSLG